MQQTVGLIYRLAKDRKAVSAGDTAYDEHMRSASRVEPPIERERTLLAPIELRKLLIAAMQSRPSFVPYLAVCAFAPVRAEEANRLEWGTHVDAEQGIIRCTADITKTKRRRAIPINATLAEWLALYSGRSGRIPQPP